MERNGITNKIGIVGGGIMGAGLARAFLAADLNVSVIEADAALVERFVQKIERVLSKEVETGKLSEEDCHKRLANLRVDTRPAVLEDASLVIEAVSEQAKLKSWILGELEKVLTPDTVIATNTSAIPISALAAGLSNPERFLGTHFFNPAHVMPLVEVVPGMDTAEPVVGAVMDFLASVGKKPVYVKECPGFLVNRVLGAYMNEVMWLLEETAGIMDMESVAGELDLPMGPCTMGDMVGWDIIHAANKTLAAYYGERFQIPPFLTTLVDKNRLGMKSERGLLDYSKTPPVPTEDLVPVTRNTDGKGLEAWKDRVLAAIMAEAIRCLDEGVASPADIDKAMVLGAGFPKGPLSWADQIGLDKVLDLLDGLSAAMGSRFWPAPILRVNVLAGFTGKTAGRGLAGIY